MKKETLRQNLPVIIAIALPVLLVIIIAILATLPNFGPRPQYDFIFTDSASRINYHTNNGCEVYSQYYAVEDTKLVKKDYVLNVFDERDIADPCKGYQQVSKKDVPNLYLYNIEAEIIQPITFEELNTIAIKGTQISPDGFSVGKRFMDRGILDLFGGNNSGVFVSKKNNHIRLNIDSYNGSFYYTNEFNVVGWVDKHIIPGPNTPNSAR
jgi:hypothetical protein